MEGCCTFEVHCPGCKTFGVTYKFVPPLGISTGDPIEVVTACEFRGTKDGDRYFDGIEFEVIRDDVQNSEEFKKDKEIKANRVFKLKKDKRHVL